VWRISSKAIIARLREQLPRMVPKAKSAEPTKPAELAPVTNSGIEVIAARSTNPIHTRPRPVFSAIASPYRANLIPANKIMARHRTNLTQTTVYAPEFDYEAIILHSRKPRKSALR
jgi:hypothetical protein